MRKIKSIFSILLKIILVCFLFFIFYLVMNKVFVGEKKVLTNNFTLTLDSNEGIYLSTPIDNFEDFLATSNYTGEDIDKDLLKIDVDNYMVNNSFENYFFSDNSGLNSLNNLKKNVNKKYGGQWEILNNVSVVKNGYLLFSSNMKDFLFNINFDFTSNMDGFGIGVDSDSELASYVDIEYIKDVDSNYCISIRDKNRDQIIYMKDIGFNSYKEAWDYYKNNKNNINSFIIGEDSVIFKPIYIKQLGLYESLKNSTIKDIKIQNYYLYCSLCVNGLGLIENNQNVVLKDNNIKYNFMENSIIFIVKDGELNPYFAYKY